MIEEEKKFKIEELKKYNEERKDIKDHIEILFIFGGLSLAAIVGGIGNYNELLHIPREYTQDFLTYSSYTLIAMGASIGIPSIKELIQDIREKTNIEKRIDDINKELDLLKQHEENKSRGGR